MIEQDINSAIVVAVKNKNETAKNVLRLVKSETERAVNGKSKTDDDYVIVIRKMLKSIETMLESAGDTRKEMVAQLTEEKTLLTDFLPKSMTREEIKQFIAENGIDVSLILGEGRSTGNVMKALKTAGKVFENGDVKVAVSHLIVVGE